MRVNPGRRLGGVKRAPNDKPSEPTVRKALVVFHGVGGHWLAPLLKPGFKHVALAIPVGDYWVTVDPKLGTPIISVPTGTTFDLATYYRDRGWTVVEADPVEIEARGLFMQNNCVGVVKKFLGLHCPFVLTPYQLYRYLTKGRP